MPAKIDEFLRLKERLDRCTEEKHRITGKLEALHETLKKEFGFLTTEEARHHIQKMDDEIADLENKINCEIQKLEERIRNEQ